MSSELANSCFIRISKKFQTKNSLYKVIFRYSENLKLFVGPILTLNIVGLTEFRISENNTKMSAFTSKFVADSKKARISRF